MSCCEWEGRAARREDRRRKRQARRRLRARACVAWPLAISVADGVARMTRVAPVSAVAAFLTQSAAPSGVTSFEALTTGSFAVAAVGPVWDSKEEPPPYLGKLLGSNAVASTPSSVQFTWLQNLMDSDAKVAFNFFTAKRVESRQTETEETRLINGLFTDPCTVEGATFGIFDMVGPADVACHCTSAMLEMRTCMWDPRRWHASCLKPVVFCGLCRKSPA